MKVELDRIVAVDGRQVHIVARAWLVDPDISEESDALAPWIRWASGFVLRHQEYGLGYEVVGPRKITLWILLLKTPSGLQRVHVEQLTCGRCGVLVDAANPTIPGLYLCLEREAEALERAWMQPEAHCPRCGGALPRRAIWAEVVG